MNKEIKNTLKRLPKSPGIYKMIDKDDKVIYIGKAKDLSKRVKQYFQKNYHHSTRSRKLTEKTEKIDYIVTDNELEAILLETNLLKQFQPRYNVLMKDGKNYVYIKIAKEDFPRIQIVRKVEKDNAKYIGPKTAAHKVNETFKILKKIFPFRHCNLDIKSIGKNKVKITHKIIKYPCLDYYIKRCIAPCIGKCSVKEYQGIIQNVEDFLGGKADKILKSLYEKMQQHAQDKEFEKAAKTRDKIKKIEEILEKQKVFDITQENKDVINYCISHDKAYFNLFQIKDGKLINQENFILSAKNMGQEPRENQEVLESFLNQYYELATDIPKEILIPHEINKNNIIGKIKTIIPKKGTKNKLLKMSLKNAQIFADRNKPSWQTESKLTKNAIKELQKLLKIKKPLKRIECYDISHLSGTETVGSMIVFKNGVPEKSMYRKFKLKTIQSKPDDYKSMEEVLTRRFLKIAQDLQHKDYTFKKARKKDKKFIESNSKVDLEKTDHQFYVIEQKGSTAKRISKPVGFIALKECSDKVTELTNLWVTPKKRGKKLGYKLLKNAINKAKPKRVYGLCKKELKEYYLLMGFEEIKKIPKELAESHKECKYKLKSHPVCMVYDKIKHKPDKSFSQIPDLVIIDGGKGQLSTAAKIFKKLKLNISHLSLAKKLEEIHLPNRKTPITLPRNNEALKLLQRARDEAHRFAISYNRKLRSKKLTSK